MDAYIIDWLRTPRGSVREGGSLASVKPIDLLRVLFDALRERMGAASDEVEDVVLGCVTAIGEQGANIAKIASLYAGWSEAISGVTLNRFCASGLDAVALSAAKVHSGMEDLVVAGGVESLSRVPMFRDGGAWFRDPEVMAKTRFLHMGLAADLLASLQGISRETCDAFALASQQKAAAAWERGDFSRSVIPVIAGEKKAERDEWMRPGLTMEKLAKLPLAFETLMEAPTMAMIRSAFPDLEKYNHVHSAGSSPGIVDGAALMAVANGSAVKRLGLQARGKILAYANVSADPVTMLTGGRAAAEKVLRKAGLQPSDIDCWEVNESFSATVIDFIQQMKIDPTRVNKNGGAIALGHALGATGTILVGTALDELEKSGGRYGCISICAGAGIGAALILERCV